MSTASCNHISKVSPKNRVPITVNPADYFDNTNNRAKSGYFVVTVNSIAFAGTGGTGEPAVYRVNFPNADSRHGYAVTDNTISLSDTTVYPNATFVTAWNYGVPGPSANVLSSSLVELVCVEIELLNPATTQADNGMSMTVDYTLTYTDIPEVYSTIPGLTTGTMSVTLKDQQGLRVTTVRPPTPTGYKALALQLSSFTTEGYGKCGCAGFAGAQAAAFVVTDTPNGAISLGQQAVSNTKESLALANNFTHVFAINDGKYDANMQAKDFSGTDYYEMLSLALSGPCGGVAKADLGYGSKLYA